MPQFNVFGKFASISFRMMRKMKTFSRTWTRSKQFSNGVHFIVKPFTEFISRFFTFNYFQRTHLCLWQTNTFTQTSLSDMHVIMKFPEGFNKEEYPKFNVAHRRKCSISVRLLLIWLVVVSGTVNLVSDIRTKLQMKRKLNIKWMKTLIENYFRKIQFFF